ncbi:MAG: hypothetical protein JWO86_6759 [Myxococcaceae bacterium]|jgi:hypothetical protein|nr:hypothetical protein [Myxococcaceae bacterium]MEA2747834.1 hypothetical protein [Myxococcales bacterium]
MTRREIVHAAVGTLAGLLVASAAWSLQKPAAPRAKADPSAMDGGDDVESLRSANANLVESLQRADQTIASLREQLAAAPAPSGVKPATPPDDRDGGRGGRRARGEPTAEDWERMAQTGTVRVRVPCLRDKPWTPNQRAMDRLGLAPGDANVIRDAYAASNKRMADQIKPLCVKALGSAEAADRVGPKACSDAILAGAKRTDPEGTQKSLVRVAQINAGNTEATPAADGAGVQQLLLAMTKETKTFEADLAAKLGPEEAKRLAWAPEMCTDRTTVRAKEDDPTAEDAAGAAAAAGRGGGR